MASVSTDSNGNRRIQFTGLDRRRRTLYLGDVSARGADDIKRVVESILEAAAVGADLPDVTFDKLAAVGLVNPRQKRDAARVTVAAFAQQYVARRSDLRPSSLIVLRHVVRNLSDFFGETATATTSPAGC